MARSSKNRRVVRSNANRRLPRFSPSSLVSPLSPRRATLRLFEDRREWHPDGPNRPARRFSGTRRPLTLVDRKPLNPDRFAYLRQFPSQTKALVAFENPSDVLVCVRRQQRREVIHATRKAGKVGQKKPRRNALSKISCRSKK